MRGKIRDVDEVPHPTTYVREWLLSVTNEHEESSRSRARTSSKGQPDQVLSRSSRYSTRTIPAPHHHLIHLVAHHWLTREQKLWEGFRRLLTLGVSLSLGLLRLEFGRLRVARLRNATQVLLRQMMAPPWTWPRSDLPRQATSMLVEEDIRPGPKDTNTKQRPPRISSGARKPKARSGTLTKLTARR